MHSPSTLKGLAEKPPVTATDLNGEDEEADAGVDLDSASVAGDKFVDTDSDSDKADNEEEPKPSLWNWVTSIPRTVSVAIGGWTGKISILAGLIKVMELSEPLIMNSFAGPIITAFVTSAFPTTVFALELIQILTTPQFYVAALAALEIFNEDLVSDYYGDGSDAAEEFAKEFLGLEDEPPKRVLSWDYVKYQAKSILVNIAGMAGGFAKVVGGMFVAGVISNLAFNTLIKQIPFGDAIPSVAKNFGSYLRSAIGSAILVLFTDEIYNTVGGWGTNVGEGVVNTVFNTVTGYAGWVAKKATKSNDSPPPPPPQSLGPDVPLPDAGAKVLKFRTAPRTANSYAVIGGPDDRRQDADRTTLDAARTSTMQAPFTRIMEKPRA